jgi:hemoglobin-like flavoprotein
MAEIAGEAWTDEVAAAWAGALGLVATAMLEGAAEAERSRSPRPNPETRAARIPAAAPC